MFISQTRNSIGIMEMVSTKLLDLIYVNPSTLSAKYLGKFPEVLRNPHLLNNTNPHAHPLRQSIIIGCTF